MMGRRYVVREVLEAARFLLMAILAGWVFFGVVHDKASGPIAGQSCGVGHHWQDFSNALDGSDVSCEADV